MKEITRKNANSSDTERDHLVERLLRTYNLDLNSDFVVVGLKKKIEPIA